MTTLKRSSPAVSDALLLPSCASRTSSRLRTSKVRSMGKATDRFASGEELSTDQSVANEGWVGPEQNGLSAPRTCGDRIAPTRQRMGRRTGRDRLRPFHWAPTAR